MGASSIDDILVLLAGNLEPEAPSRI